MLEDKFGKWAVFQFNSELETTLVVSKTITMIIGQFRIFCQITSCI